MTRPFWANPQYLVGELVRVRISLSDAGHALARVVGHDDTAPSRGPWILRVLNGEHGGVLSSGWRDHDIEPAGMDQHTVEVGDSAPDGTATRYNRRHVLDVDVARGNGRFSIVAARLGHGHSLREITPSAELARLLHLQLECDYGDQLRNEVFVGPLELLKTLTGAQQAERSLATRIGHNLPRERPELQERLEDVRASIADLAGRLPIERSR